MRKVGWLTASAALKKGLENIISTATGLTERRVQKKLQEVDSNTLVRDAFAEYWPCDASRLGGFTVMFARSAGLQEEIAEVAKFHQNTVKRRLKDAHGGRLVKNLFEDRWPNEANANNGTDTSQTGARRPVTGDLVANQWEIIRKIGSGGFGTVYEARDMRLSCDVVLKFPNDTESTDRLLAEIGLAFNLNHPNICAYRHIDKDGSFGTFVVLQHCGVSLEDLIEKHRKRRQTLSVQYAFEVIRQAAAGIDYAHEHEVLHLDIKPGNILVDEKDKKKVKVRISDFGISLLGRRTIRRLGTVVGTPIGFSPGFAAPEQVREDTNVEVSRKSDQYSLALVLCAMLEGEVFNSPYTRRNFARLSREQNAAIKQALERDPSKRYPSCLDFAKALGAAA